MGSLSPWHLIILLSILLPVIPIWRILRRLGLAPAWALLYFVPIGGLIGLWLLAWGRWPNLPDPAEQARVF
jgi:hypothetical protein